MAFHTSMIVLLALVILIQGSFSEMCVEVTKGKVTPYKIVIHRVDLQPYEDREIVLLDRTYALCNVVGVSVVACDDVPPVVEIQNNLKSAIVQRRGTLAYPGYLTEIVYCRFPIPK